MKLSARSLSSKPSALFQRMKRKYNKLPTTCILPILLHSQNSSNATPACRPCNTANVEANGTDAMIRKSNLSSALFRFTPSCTIFATDMRSYNHIFIDLDDTVWDFNANSHIALALTYENLHYIISVPTTTVSAAYIMPKMPNCGTYTITGK